MQLVSEADRLWVFAVTNNDQNQKLREKSMYVYMYVVNKPFSAAGISEEKAQG